MDNTHTFTVVLTREELRTNGQLVVGNSVYALGAALFEWGGEYNRDESGTPAASVHGHHAAQRLAEYAVAEWTGSGNPLAGDLTRANDRIHEASLMNADLRARLLPALDEAGVRFDDPPDALHLWIQRQAADLERVADENTRLAEALAEAQATIDNERGWGEPPCEGWVPVFEVEGRAEDCTLRVTYWKCETDDSLVRYAGVNILLGGAWWAIHRKTDQGAVLLRSGVLDTVRAAMRTAMRAAKAEKEGGE